MQLENLNVIARKQTEATYCVHDAIALILFLLVRNACNYSEMKYYHW